MKTKPFYLGDAHNWEHVKNVVQILCYDTEELRDKGEKARKRFYNDRDMDFWYFNSYDIDFKFLVSKRSLKLRAVFDGARWIPIIREADGTLREEYESCETVEKCFELLKSKINFVL
jgi:hypothetical protein